MPQNVWLGTTVESQKNKYRIDFLRELEAPVKFLSCEPLIEDLQELNLNGINWVIVGGESGMQARPMQEQWVINIKNQCLEKDIAFFFKQWGGINKKKAGNLLDGVTWEQYPSIE